MKTFEKSEDLKEQKETVSKKPQALSYDELEQVAGGGNIWEDATVKQIPKGWPIA